MNEKLLQDGSKQSALRVVRRQLDWHVHDDEARGTGRVGRSTNITRAAADLGQAAALLPSPPPLGPSYPADVRSAPFVGYLVSAAARLLQMVADEVEGYGSEVLVSCPTHTPTKPGSAAVSYEGPILEADAGPREVIDAINRISDRLSALEGKR